MTREFIYTSPFRKSWEMMGLNDDDLKELENILLSNPQTGSVIQGTGGARKMRIKQNIFQLYRTHVIKLYGQGKSGGARVIYLDVYEKEKLYLIFAYPKNVQSDLTGEQKKAVKSIVELIKRE